MGGHKEFLGMWLSENEGTKALVSVLKELQNRGVKDICKAIYTMCLSQPSLTKNNYFILSASNGVLPFNPESSLHLL